MLPLELHKGSFYRDGRKILPTGPVYFGRLPGNCDADYFAESVWPHNEAYLDSDFSRMREVGFTWAIPFINMNSFYRDGKPLEEMFARVARMIELARQNDFYLIPFPGVFLHDPKVAASILGRQVNEIGNYPQHGAFNPIVFEANVKIFSEFSLRFGQEVNIPLIMNRASGRLWTGYAGFRPGEGESLELLPVKPYWQQWLREQYQDDFATFLADHPRLPEAPKNWNEVALPVEVYGQFTEADSRTFSFLKFQSSSSAETHKRFYREVHKVAPWIKTMDVHEGCEYNTGPQETYIPGLSDYDAVWVEMYGFNMVSGSHVAPRWQRVGFHEPTTGKYQIDSLSVCTEAWERARYLKAAAPNTALIPCHGSVLHAFMRWAPEERDQRILFERLQRVYMEAGADGIGFWAWSDDETSARPEPEYFYREGESMGIINTKMDYRPVARRMRTYLSNREPKMNVSSDVLLLRPTAHLMGLHMVDGNMTMACITSALARLGIAPEVKATWYQGKGAISLEELLPYKLVIVGADEYRKDFAQVPATLLEYTRRGGRVLLAMGNTDSLLTPTMVETPSEELAELLAHPIVDDTYNQQYNAWTVSLRWQLKDDVLLYWDQRRGRYLPGREEKEFTFKWVQLPAHVQIIAEAVAPAPERSKNPEDLKKYFVQLQKMGPWSPLFYRNPIGKGAAYVFTYSLNVFRSLLDETDVQRDDWDWLLQAAIDDAKVETDPCHSLSVLAQEFFNFRPTR